ncbi:hypothetical protein S83_070633, partial [Arachis hypogaea]
KGVENLVIIGLRLAGKDVEEGFDITLAKHKGQYALRKLYHESPRFICVLHTSPTCGPYRTLKPILIFVTTFRYKAVADLFSHMSCSLRLLHLCKKSPTFQNICAQ